MAIPLRRATWFLFITIVQCAIAVLLLVAGIEWLTSTTEIVELLLNGVALSYIMDIDELFFRVFMPRKLASLMSLLEPLPVRWPLGVLVRSLVLAVAAVGVIVATLFLILQQLEDVMIVRDIVCPDDLLN